MKTAVSILLCAVALAGLARAVAAHCEVPCGIYNDKMRIVMIREDLATIEKAMAQIREIGAAESPDWNQLVRWVTTKEDHANRIQDVVSQYFLTQRVKAAAEGDEAGRKRYVTQVTLLHQLLVAAMKTKQTTDATHVATARKLLDDFAASYFTAEDLEHLKEHD